MRRHPERILVAIAFFILLQPPLYAIDRLEIDWNRDVRYLPYQSDQMKSERHGSDRKRILRPAQVTITEISESSSGLLALSYNRRLAEDGPSHINFHSFGDYNAVTNNPIWMTICEFMSYRDTLMDQPIVVAGGHRNDSAFAVKIEVGSGRREFCYLASGADHTANGVWEPDVVPYWIGDLDGNGHMDAVIDVLPGRDCCPRELVCVDIDSMSIMWKLPMVTYPLGELFLCRDTAEASLLFTNYGSGHPFPSVPHFDDNYCYLTRVSSKGQVITNFIIGVSGIGTSLWHAEDTRTYYLGHALPFHPDSTLGSWDVSPAPYISELDSLGNPLRTISCEEYAMGFWTDDYSGDLTKELFVITREGSILIYDRNLTLLARSKPGPLRGGFPFHKLPPLEGTDSVLCFGSPLGTEIYSSKLKRLSAIPYSASYLAAAEMDSDGHMVSLLLSHDNAYQVVKFSRRNWVDYASIFYLDYQYYILALLSSLAVGVVAIGSNRQRVAAQKKEIEAAHRQLATTHEELKRTQQQLIEAEKYKQAKDIAGGFAHEIRNALLPAEVALAKLLRQGDTDNKPQTAIRQAVSRALDLTSLVAQYTKLDQPLVLCPVNLADVAAEAVGHHCLRAAEAGVEITTAIPQGLSVQAVREQLVMALDNLIGNALDALAGHDGGTIAISANWAGDRVELSVKDTGPGISPDVLPRIFDAFYSTRPETGRGLGLAIVKKIAEGHGGIVQVQSMMGQGAEFVIKLPRDRGHQ